METPALRRVREAKEGKEAWSDEMRKAMIAAYLEGHSYRQIAKAAGMSHVYVMNVLKAFVKHNATS